MQSIRHTADYLSIEQSRKVGERAVVVFVVLKVYICVWGIVREGETMEQ